jgi:hypothetical protein
MPAAANAAPDHRGRPLEWAAAADTNKNLSHVEVVVEELSREGAPHPKAAACYHPPKLLKSVYTLS